MVSQFYLSSDLKDRLRDLVRSSGDNHLNIEKFAQKMVVEISNLVDQDYSIEDAIGRVSDINGVSSNILTNMFDEYQEFNKEPLDITELDVSF